MRLTEQQLRNVIKKVVKEENEWRHHGYSPIADAIEKEEKIILQTVNGVNDRLTRQFQGTKMNYFHGYTKGSVAVEVLEIDMNLDRITPYRGVSGLPIALVRMPNGKETWVVVRELTPLNVAHPDHHPGVDFTD